MIKIVAFAGSLRKDSYNRALLRAAQQLLPAAEASMITFDLAGFPSYNQDQEATTPPVVAEFKASIRQADALVIVTPEYNYSVPGLLKNAIDWASRPYGDNSFDDKPVAIMGASIGMTGTARAQYHLRQMFVFLNAHPLNKPEIMVSMAADKFSNGELTDAATRGKVQEQLLALVAWTKRLRGPQ